MRVILNMLMRLYRLCMGAFFFVFMSVDLFHPEKKGPKNHVENLF